MPNKPSKKGPGKATVDHALRIGDRVTPEGSTSVYEVTRIGVDGTTADICLIHTNLERFRVPASTLKLEQR